MASDRAPHFAFVGLAYLLTFHFGANEVEPLTRLHDEAFMIVALPNGLLLQLSHHAVEGTTLRRRDPTAAVAFESFVHVLELTELPTRWTPMHPSIHELGADLPGMPTASPIWAWVKAIWTGRRAV